MCSRKYYSNKEPYTLLTKYRNKQLLAQYCEKQRAIAESFIACPCSA